ncbi:hypothetical protein SAR116_0731 [Candidatus Puniceispirillum marinum IMCC1322]|uniref:Uncharacterized protein n=1 Tax=Puniceispirillum marinum (strain IMCC1322) TaxID=488538 RepID=D5BRS6_PUNMI|nr:hypothetical protein SAR116_0731 [Candidatus Puniceispirillum marinum IMCC1322]
MHLYTRFILAMSDNVNIVTRMFAKNANAKFSKTWVKAIICSRQFVQKNRFA